MKFSVPKGPVWLSDALSVCGFDIPESEGEKQWEDAWGAWAWFPLGFTPSSFSLR